MSPTLAFCTLRILPRIGSSAWNSELRAKLAVPRAESPSTMNSSLSSIELDRQSLSLGGKLDDSSAVLRRWFSLWTRAATRVRDAFTTFSMTVRACGRSDALVELRNLPSSVSTTWATNLVTGGVPSTSLVCPSNCGSGRRTVTTAVRPSSTSSLVISSPLFSSRVPSSPPRNAFNSPRSKPVTWVPPLGVATMFTNERSIVS